MGKAAIVKEIIKRAKSGDGLAMDYASRMERARDMGFDTSQIYYHGTGAIASLMSPEQAQANTQKAIAELERRGLSHLIPSRDTITPAKYPLLGKASTALRGVDTPFGKPYEATADVLDRWSYGKNAKWPAAAGSIAEEYRASIRDS
jgi:hypothetical protein